MAVKGQTLNSVDKEELQDLLLNIGILPELNRTFLNPLGLKLILDKKLNLDLQKTDDPEGIIAHTVDTFRLKVFNDYRNEKHRKRQQMAGFVIQTRDLIRKDQLIKDKDLHLSSPENLKLKKLLSCIDDAAYKMKCNLMKNSTVKDKDAADIPFSRLHRKMEVDFDIGNYLEGAIKAILINFQEEIELELILIQKIKTKQDKAFKGKK
jgi:hypothetical protein